MSDTSKCWMRTYQNGSIYPLDPRVEDISIERIAHQTAKIQRYSGAPEEDYTVAEHQVLISEALERDGYPIMISLEGLLHDGDEFVLGDRPKPLKNALADAFPEAEAFLKAAEDRMSQCIAEKFRLPWPFHPVVKEYDNRICKDEMAALFEVAPWDHGGEPLGVHIQCWDWRTAKQEYLNRFYYLWERLHGPKELW